MALINSISGIRGTIGGKQGEGLSPDLVVAFAAAYGNWIKNHSDKRKVVIGRDGRISGPIISQLVSTTLQTVGIDVLDLGFSTTPTVEMAVTMENAAGGIIITASHNPKHWNAMKLLNSTGEFLSAADAQQLKDIVKEGNIVYADVDNLGSYEKGEGHIEKHIEAILALPLVDRDAIAAKNFSVVVDAINSTGAMSIPPLLEALGVKEVSVINAEINGEFAHNPEPKKEHLDQICGELKNGNADVGFVVDPDVDRLAMVSNDGEMFGEEYTLVAVADYVLQHKKGNTVSNLSSSRALRDVTEKHGGKYFASAVGEVNVVTEMKKQNAVIGGEGNGGIIYGDLHYGRDALLGIALFLSHLAKSGKTCAELRASYPDYFMTKSKIDLQPGLDLVSILKKMETKYADTPKHTIDGLKLEFENEWVHLRKSNTEPIIRIYTESTSQESADALAERFRGELQELV